MDLFHNGAGSCSEEVAQCQLALQRVSCRGEGDASAKQGGGSLRVCLCKQACVFAEQKAKVRVTE